MMLRRLLLPLLFAAHACASAATPNLVLINTDDLGYGDIAPFGSATPTPRLTQMAAEGRLLKSHYGAVVCSPSRAALMTGCYPKRVLQIPHVLFPVAAVGLNPEEQNIAKVLHAAGYVTGIIGKWHLGDQPEFLPLQQGFDYYYGLPYSNDMGPAEDGTKSNYGKPIPKPNPKAKKNPNAQTQDETGVRGKQPPLAMIEGTKVVERIRQDEQVTITHRYTDHATAFIREQAKAGKPFFLYLAHNAVHFPHYPEEKYRGLGPTQLAEMVREVDWSTGQILDTLKQLKADANTLVIFTSDNGGSVPHGSINQPLRGSKGETWEGGIREPTIAWWPGTIPAGTSTDAITSMMDFLPTLAAVAHAKLDPTRKIDGVNILSVLTGKGDSAPRQHFFYYRGALMEAVRQGPWKLHLVKKELYNLDQDIGESKDVAAEHPEEVQKLQALADTMRDDLGLNGFGPGCRPMGRVANPKPLIGQP